MPFTIAPEISANPQRKIRPGHLVLTTFDGWNRFAITHGDRPNESASGLVFLPTEGRGCEIASMSSRDAAFDLGDNLIIEPEIFSGNFEFFSKQMTDLDGAVYVDTIGAASLEVGNCGRTVFLDLRSFTIHDRLPETVYGRITKWELQLPRHDDRITILEMDCNSPVETD